MKRLPALALLLFSVIAQAQVKDDEHYDTARRTDPVSTSYELLIRNFDFLTAQDSTMLFFQQYDRTKRDHIGIQNLGDVHTPFIDLQFSPFETMGLVSGMTPFMNLYFTNDKARFYNARMPYTEFQYAQGKGGQRGMIDFDALHTQNFGRQFNTTVNYHSTSNDGFYNRQSLSCKNIQFSSYFISKNNRYNANVILTWNKTNMMENGGIEQSEATNTLFRELSGSVRIVNSTLNNARNINRFREHSFTQVYWLMMDRDTGKKKAAKGLLGISHGFTAIRQSNYYTDNGTDFGFYDSVYHFNSTYTSDSFNLNQYSNSIDVFTPLRNSGLSFKAGIRYDNFTVFQSTNPSNYLRHTGHNTSLNAQLHFNLTQSFKSEAYLNYYPEGANQSDYALKWINRALIGHKKNWAFTASLFANSRQAFYRQNSLFSNHYIWENNLKPTRYQSLSAGIGKDIKRPSSYNAFYYTLPAKAFELRVNYTRIDRLVYYAQDNTPAQTGDGESCLQAVAQVHLNLRTLQCQQNLVYQVFSNGLSNKLQLPSLLSKTSLYIQTYAFKKASFIQIGFDANITTSYKAGFYNPALLNFRVSEKSVGAYPFLDFFINAEVKTARFFFKIEHINQDLINNNLFPNYLFVSPYQPSAPRRFRLGLAWKFYY